MFSSNEIPFINLKRSSNPYLMSISGSQVVSILYSIQQNLQLQIHRTRHHTHFQGITLSDAIFLSTSSSHAVSILVPLAAFN
jgi:hypothetical protein